MWTSIFKYLIAFMYMQKRRSKSTTIGRFRELFDLGR